MCSKFCLALFLHSCARLRRSRSIIPMSTTTHGPGLESSPAAGGVTPKFRRGHLTMLECPASVGSQCVKSRKFSQIWVQSARRRRAPCPKRQLCRGFSPEQARASRRAGREPKSHDQQTTSLCPCPPSAPYHLCISLPCGLGPELHFQSSDLLQHLRKRKDGGGKKCLSLPVQKAC